MLRFTPPFNPNQPVPNGPFYSPETYTLQSGNGNLIVGYGLEVDPFGFLNVDFDIVGTVNYVGLISSTLIVSGSPITRAGTFVVNAPIATASTLGIVKAGTFITVDPSGVLGVPFASTVSPGIVQLNNTTTALGVVDQALTAGAGANLQQQINALALIAHTYFGGTFDAVTGLVLVVTDAGTQRGLVVGQPLPIPSAPNTGLYVVATVSSPSYIPPGSVVSYQVWDGDSFIMSSTAWIYLPTGFDAYPATTSTAGIVRLATVAEVEAGTDNTIAITPFGLIQSGVIDNPAGNNTEVQYNDSDNFGASPNFTFNAVNNQVSAPQFRGITDVTIGAVDRTTNGPGYTTNIVGGLGFQGEGGQVSILGGVGELGNGGAVNIQGGLSADGGIGGVLNLTGGEVVNGAAGNVNILGGPSTLNGTGGNVTITAGSAGIVSGAPGNVSILGANTPTGTGGLVTITGSAAPQAGYIQVTGGFSTAADATGGAVTITGGVATGGGTAFGGTVTIQGGNQVTFDGTGGELILGGGQGGNIGDGGNVYIAGGSSGPLGGNVGTVNITDIAEAVAIASYIPTAPQDLATKAYVDTQANDLTSDTFYQGAGAPLPSFGVNGEFYVSTPDYTLYNKIAEVWENTLNTLNTQGLQSIIDRRAYEATTTLGLDSLIDFYGNPYAVDAAVTAIFTDVAVTTQVILDASTGDLGISLIGLSPAQIVTLQAEFYPGANLSGEILGPIHWDSEVYLVEIVGVDGLQVFARVFDLTSLNTLLSISTASGTNANLYGFAATSNLFVNGVETSTSQANRMLVKSTNSERWVAGPDVTSFLTAGTDISVNYDAVTQSWTIESTGVTGVTGIAPIIVDNTDPDGPVISLDTPSITQTSSTHYVNANYNDIQTVLDGLSVPEFAQIFYAAGYIDGSDVLITNQVNINITGPETATGTYVAGFGNTAPRNLVISGITSTRVRLENIQIKGSTTIDGTEGRHFFKNVGFDAALTFLNATTNFVVFEGCNFGGTVTIPATFAGTVTFVNCNFNGNTLTSLAASPLQVVLTNTANLALTTSNVFFVGLNSNGASVNLVATDVFALGTTAVTPADPTTQSAAAIVAATGELISVDNYDGGTF